MPALTPSALILGLMLQATAPAPAGDLLFISPMGEPFYGDRDHPPEAAWFAAADANHDGAITRAEMEADADRFFARLDVDRSGDLDPKEIERYETDVAPQVSSEGPAAPEADPQVDGGDVYPGAPKGERERRGAASFSYFAIPEPVSSADTNFDGGVSAREFDQAADRRFDALDRNGDGRLEAKELPPAPRRKARR